MTEAKRRILAAVRRALGNAASADADAARAELLRDEPPRPRWQGERIERFLQQFERAVGTYTRVTGTEAVPAAAAEFLQRIGEPPRLLLAPHPLLRDLAWPPGLETVEETGRSAEFTAALVVADCAVAETGSVVMPSGPQRPTAMNLLPDHLLVVLHATEVVDYMEDVWRRLLSRGGLPRTVNFITGPSRTADVEQTIQIGAHGARRLHLILVG